MVFNPHLPKSHTGSIFCPVYDFTPAVPVEVIDDDGEVHEEMQKVSKKGKRHLRYLPGERLLLRLSREKQKKQMKKNNVKVQDIDVDTISKSVSNLLKSF